MCRDGMEIHEEREWVKVSSNRVSRSIKKLKNTDTDNKNNTELSVFQYVFEIRSKYLYQYLKIKILSSMIISILILGK